MIQLATALFFLVALLGTLAILHMTIRDNIRAILAALSGDPLATGARLTAPRPRATVRPRPMTGFSTGPRTAQRSRAAA